MIKKAFSGIQAHGRKPSTSKTSEIGNRVKRAGAFASAATALALGLTLAPIQAQTASAYGLTNCSEQAHVYDVDPFRINTGSVDFGGGTYSAEAGSSSSDAIVCWSDGQKTVQLVGTMYTNSKAAHNTFTGCVRIVLRFNDTAGKNIAAAGTNRDLCDADGKNPQEYTFHEKRLSSGYGGAKFSLVNVYAYQKSSASSTQWQLVAERHLHYGPPD